MKGVFIKIFVMTIVVLLFYTYIGQVVPQYPKGNPTPTPPKITPASTAQDLVSIGQNLVETRGCTACHFIGGTEKGRCPDLADVGGRAASRYKGYNAEQYLLRRLTDPDFSAIEGFPKIMPKVWQPPIALSWPEIKAVTAYLESLGGNVTTKITPEDLKEGDHLIQFSDGATVTVKKAEAQQKINSAQIQEGHDVMMSLPEKERCTTCHKIGNEKPPGWGPVPGQFCPDLSDIGAMHDIDYVEQKIKNPQSLPTVTGYPKGMMPMDFPAQLKKLYGLKSDEKLAALAGFIISHNGTQTFSREYSPWIIGFMLAASLAFGLFAGKRGV